MLDWADPQDGTDRCRFPRQWPAPGGRNNFGYLTVTVPAEFFDGLVPRTERTCWSRPYNGEIDSCSLYPDPTARKLTVGCFRTVSADSEFVTYEGQEIGPVVFERLTSSAG